MSCNFKKSEIKKAIKGSGGIMSTIAKRLKCDWMTAQKYVRLNDLEDEVKSEKEALLDLAESKLIQNIQEQDTTSILFYLKTQGKKRGYVERQEIEATVDNVTKLTPEQRAKRIEELKAKLNND